MSVAVPGLSWGRFRRDKAIEVLLYILSRGCHNKYNALQVAYFADKEHMRRSGSTICKDRYIAMRNGPVPSGMYDMFKDLADGTISKSGEYDYLPNREPDMDMFSDIDIECLDRAVERYGRLPFDKLRELSHKEPDYLSAPPNGEIAFDDFLRSVDEDGYIASYLAEVAGA